MDGHLKTAKFLAKLLDSQFKVGKFSFGLDPILGFLPISGDLISFCLSLYIVWIGFQSRVPIDKMITMIWNAVSDFLIGLIPVVGDIADFTFKSNEKNLAIIEEYGRINVVEGQFV